MLKVKKRRSRFLHCCLFIVFLILIFHFSIILAGAETRFLGDYPKDREPGWSNECQGVTHDDSFWYVTQRDKLWKFPVSFDLNKDVVPYVKSGLVKYVEIPASLRNLGYDHFGDLDYYNGYLYIPVEDTTFKQPIIAVFRAQDLAYLMSAKLDVVRGGSHAMACALNPRDGLLYVSQYKHNDDSSIRVQIYRQEIKNNRLSLAHLRECSFFEEDGRKSLYPRRIQGLAFSASSGLLYLVSDSGSSGGIFVFDPQTGRRLQWITVAYDPATAGEINEELEGITIWNLDRGKAPNIEGQVHLIMIDNDWPRSIYGDDDLYFKHFRVPGELHLSGLEDCLPVNYQDLQVRREGSKWEIWDGTLFLGPFKSEAEAQKARSVIVHYKINQRCFVGRPNPKMIYWLSNGRAPEGSMPGEDCLPINLSRLQMIWVDGRWLIVDDTHRMLDFGGEGLECLSALQAIKKYGFSYIGFAIRPKASLVYFRK